MPENQNRRNVNVDKNIIITLENLFFYFFQGFRFFTRIDKNYEPY